MPSTRGPQLRLLVHLPGRGVAGSGADGSLAHRDIPAWGVRGATGAVVESGLLLVADGLVVDPAAARGDLFGDPPALWQTLMDRGRIVVGPATAPCPDPAGAGPGHPQQVGGWLAAQRAGGTAWKRQEALAESLHRQGPGGQTPWREALRAAGLSEAKHRFRNRLQTLEVLATLGSWGVGEGVDEEIAAEVLAADPLHVLSNLRAAAAAGAVPHDWVDMAPLYACVGLAAEARLEVRLPVLSGADPAAVADLLGSDVLAAARAAMRAGLWDTDGSAAAEAVEQELRRIVPARLCVQELSRTLAFHGASCEATADLCPPGVGLLAIDRWVPPSAD